MPFHAKLGCPRHLGALARHTFPPIFGILTYLPSRHLINSNQLSRRVAAKNPPKIQEPYSTSPTMAHFTPEQVEIIDEHSIAEIVKNFRKTLPEDLDQYVLSEGMNFKLTNELAVF
jgi:hypothetical protein